MTYAISMAMAYYGPNAELFTNIDSSFWGEPIDDISEVFKTMSFLFAFDTLFASINSICIWKIMKVNMLQELGGTMKKYWLFMGIKLSVNMLTYYASNDVNFGSDASGKFEWITPNGRISLIFNSTNVTDKDMLMFPTNESFI